MVPIKSSAAPNDTSPAAGMTPEQYSHIRSRLAEASRRFGGIDYVSPAFGMVRDAMAEVDRLRAELETQAEKVTAFCAQRAEYVTALLNCHPDNGHDYDRWQGHAAARRQLSELLGLPVTWPAEDQHAPADDDSQVTA